MSKKKIRMSVKWGISFFLAIPVFALIYLSFPDSWWKDNGCVDFWNSLYYSTVTITTLGFGDLSLTNTAGRMTTVIESLWGVLAIGMFLNSMSNEQAEKVSKEEKEKVKRQKEVEDKEKFKLRYNIIKKEIENYFLFAYGLTTPMDKRDFDSIDTIDFENYNFKINDLCDLYQLSLLISEPLLKPIIEIYFEAQGKLYNDLKRLLEDIEIHDGNLESLLLDIVTNINNFDCADAIIGYQKLSSDKSKLSDEVSKEIKNYNGEVKIKGHSVLDPIIEFYFFLSKTIKDVASFEKRVNIYMNS